MKENEKIIIKVSEKEVYENFSSAEKKYWDKLSPLKRKRILEKAKKDAIRKNVKDKKKKEDYKHKQLQNKKREDAIKNRQQTTNNNTGTKDSFLSSGSKTQSNSDTFESIDRVKAPVSSSEGKNVTSATSSSSSASKGQAAVAAAREVSESTKKIIHKMDEAASSLTERKKGAAKDKNKDNQNVSDDGTYAKNIFKKISGALVKVSALVGGVVSLAGAPLIGVLIPIIVVIFLILIVIIIIIAIVCAMFGFSAAATQEASYKANVSIECEAYRSIVADYADEYNISAYEEILMCIMMQESGGKGDDVMQSSECGYNTKYPHSPNSITDPEYSIYCGVRHFADCLEKSGCESADDFDKLYLAIQGYNYGPGYITWALNNYGKYTEENAAAYSVMMAAKLGWSSYGDTEYVQHVMRYYIEIAYDSDSIDSADASTLIDEMMEKYSDVDVGRFAVIGKGAALIGKVSYSMNKRDVSGSDSPSYLDCSSFVAWAFHKSGYTDVQYASTTDTFLSSSNLKKIKKKELKPGDVGLKLNKTGNSGGANHIGIFVGTDDDGNSWWLHCSSYKYTADGVVYADGVRIDKYSNFAYFYRYTGFSD